MTTTKSAKYCLHYWPGIPGRGEYVRLAFESTGHPYSEKNSPMNVVMKVNKTIGQFPHFAPPVLEVQEDSSSSFISQTPAILAYLAPILHLDGVSSKDDKLSPSAASIRRAQVNQLTLTILDLGNEVHDVHHPIASAAFYEEQKEEAIKRAKDFRGVRIPKFFTLFQLTLESNTESNEWLIGQSYSTADLTLFQVVDGLHFAFPKLMSALQKQGKFNKVFDLRNRVASVDSLKSYLQSKRRLPYSNGIYRHYSELDGEE